MRIGEGAVMLSQPITAAVSLKEGQAPVPQGPIVMVPPEEDVVLVSQGLPVAVPSEGRGCLIFTVPNDEGPVPTW
jgi:hypothetical protein